MRRIATRYDKLTTKYLAIIELPPIRIWLTATSVSGHRTSAGLANANLAYIQRKSIGLTKL
jgi:hypothetical protein